MAVSTIFSSFISLIIIIGFFTITHAENFGFSAELIHRDSINSPSYKSFESPSQRIANAFRRSINRAKQFNPTATFSTLSSRIPETDISPSGGAYLMNITIGTPPVDIVAIADTGSDLIWTQCIPCPQCYKQDAPLFNPSRSKTYKNIPCESKFCGEAANAGCDGKICAYEVQYGDQSHSNGNLAVESIGVSSRSGKRVIFPKVIFGCGHDNAGTFSKDASGIIGLGAGNVSLIKQMGRVGGGIFSYCLTPIFSNITSKISFGANAIVAGKGALQTPLGKGAIDTFYYLALKGISVGDNMFELVTKESSNRPRGNVIIDSGTTLTMLPATLYDQVESAVKDQIREEIVPDPTGELGLCYKVEGDNFEAPILTAHFAGADITLYTENTFVKVSEDDVCFAIIPMQILSGDVTGIIGNIAQTNYLVGYDLKKHAITFKRTNCAGKA